MKHCKIFRILALAVIISLLALVIPATPALAIGEVDLSPEQGKIGDEITIVGMGFNKSTEDTDRYANIYFSSDEASTAHDIDDEVTHYKLIREGRWLDEEGDFEYTFKVPDELDDGDDEEEVETGTYYIYVTHYPYNSIRGVAEFTVIGGEITIDPDEGPVGTEVEISGADFSSRESIFIEYDGDDIDIESGDEETDRSGEFETIIIIPESTAGDHTITVIGEESANEVETPFTVEPKITISPTSGAVETTVTVSGTGFGNRSDVTVLLNNTEVATDRTDRDGSFEVTFKVPAVETGTYDVEAWDEDNNSDKVEFTIGAAPTPTPTPTTSASLSATTGNIGTELTVTGIGYAPGATVTINYDTTKVATATAKTDGAFSATFKVPASKYGKHNITISDGTTTTELTFTMESAAPPIPMPLLPEMDTKAESPVHFDWKDVDDPSGVTYTLQIATSRDFAANSIVLEKKGLTKSEYTITEKEKLKAVSKKEPYHWRIKAIDDASNEGEWTGAGSFYTGFSFSMPSWLIYTLFGLAAFFCGVFGFWLGRRTSFY